VKNGILILFLAVGSIATFAQGKVAFAMDLPITMGPLPFLLPQDLALANQPVPTSGPLPSGIMLRIGLYGGTSSSSLSLISSEAINPVGGTGLPDGAITRLHLICPFAGGQLAYFQVKLWNSAYASYEAQAAAGHVDTGLDYDNVNNIFTMTPGTSIIYPQIYNGGGTTWAAAGNETSLLVLCLVPEPSVLALVGLAAVTMLIRWRRASS
jgi:hypothetical protein